MSQNDHGAGQSPELPRFRPLTRRRRLLVVALAVATAVTIVSMLLDPPGRPAKPRDAQVRECRDGRGAGCVGGKAEVLPLVAGPTASGGTGR